MSFITQAGILGPLPSHAAFLFLAVRPGCSPASVVVELGDLALTDDVLVGLGQSLLTATGAVVPGLREMPEVTGPSGPLPVTPTALLLRIGGADPGHILHLERRCLRALPSFELVDRVDCFVHGESRDLSGYEDGTENPTGEDAAAAACQSGEPGLAGGSVVAIQRWLHDLDALEAMSRHTRDHTIGRDRESNEELADAPASAHVKRTAQEDFEPAAFVVRRSMPWRDHRGAGLVFVSFSATLHPFEALLRRMVGEDDGIVDGLFGFTQPETGATFWCPPLCEGRLDLRICS